MGGFHLSLNVIFMLLSYYGPYFSPTALFVIPLMTIAIAMIAKVIFMKCFRHYLWRGFFLASMLFSAVAIPFYYLSIYITGESSMLYIFGMGLFHGLAILYLACYLVDFILRLICRGKQKNREVAE